MDTINTINIRIYNCGVYSFDENDNLIGFINDNPKDVKLMSAKHRVQYLDLKSRMQIYAVYHG